MHPSPVPGRLAGNPERSEHVLGLPAGRPGAKVQQSAAASARRADTADRDH
jgi:hypothetical protein